MHQRGATVTVHDPHAVRTALRRHPELDYADDLEDSAQNDLVGAVIAALLAMRYINPAGARTAFDEIFHRRTRRTRQTRRTRRGREAAAPDTCTALAAVSTRHGRPRLGTHET